MKRVLLLVEGQTEETFVKTVLAPHFWAFETAIEVTRVVTKRVQGRRAYRGGCLNYSQVKADLQRLLSSNPAAVTTLFDYYALPDDFPGRRALRESASCFDRVAHLEAELARSVGDPRFIPNIVLHEFEGLLFSMPSEIAKVLLADARAAELEAIAAAHASPEEIDEGPENAPVEADRTDPAGVPEGAARAADRSAHRAPGDPGEVPALRRMAREDGGAVKSDVAGAGDLSMVVARGVDPSIRYHDEACSCFDSRRIRDRRDRSPDSSAIL